MLYAGRREAAGWVPAPTPTLCPAPQLPAMSRIGAWPLQPQQWRQRGLSWAEVVLMVTDYIVSALLCPPQGEKTSFPLSKGLSVGSMGAAPFPLTGLAQAQSMAVEHS